MKVSFISVFLSLGLTYFAQAKLPADEFFRVETIAEGLADPMEIAIADSGEIFVIERTGSLKMIPSTGGAPVEIASLPVETRKDSFARECGLLGITLDPSFHENRWIYLYYSPKKKALHQLARFTLRGINLTEPKMLLEVPQDPEENTCHEAGSLTFGPDGLLYLSTGDNTCPFKSSGSAPIDERRGRKHYDAQRSASNTNDLRGKILRIRPTDDGGYEIPEGNLFPEGTRKTRPEIFIMGCRNPYRISVDQKNSYLYWGMIGPDAAKDTERGPRGYDEINQAREAGNFGWPYFAGDNIPYAAYDFKRKKTGKKYDPAKPVNKSRNNTGLKKLPPAQPAFWHYTHASACAGPVYYSDLYPDGGGKFPSAFDSSLIVYDWTANWLKVLKLDQDGKILSTNPWLESHRFIHPNDMELGPKGELYILEYGSKWYGGSDGRIRKITYTDSAQEIQTLARDPRLQGLPETHPGSDLIGGSTCLACHLPKEKSIGPSYLQVAQKYSDATPATIEELSQKILKGGVGVWGQQPMPPHPQHNSEETQQMVEAILQVTDGHQ